MYGPINTSRAMFTNYLLSILCISRCLNVSYQILCRCFDIFFSDIHTIDEHKNETRKCFSSPHMHCRTESPFPLRLHVARFLTTVTSPPAGVRLWCYQRTSCTKHAPKSSLFQGNCKRITARVSGFSVPDIREIRRKYLRGYAEGTWLIAGVTVSVRQWGGLGPLGALPPW